MTALSVSARYSTAFWLAASVVVNLSISIHAVRSDSKSLGTRKIRAVTATGWFVVFSTRMK